MAKYRIQIKRSAQKALNKLPSKDLTKILAKIDSLSYDPRPPGCQKLLTDEKYKIRYRIYRILYSIRDDVLLVCVVKVGPRNKIYG